MFIMNNSIMLEYDLLVSLNSIMLYGEQRLKYKTTLIRFSEIDL